ncbi:uncharacterized protein LOC122208858 [Panthera leo]|uniref:uncharacterized protein LOC122208858 n=1 Tax=Panthera leo TaxID=9689 RepID=UPI001C6A36F4|nr:uncharacterized protein LOC122208858 [Panthera leo]
MNINQKKIPDPGGNFRNVSSKYQLGEVKLRPAFPSSNRSGQKQKPKRGIESRVDATFGALAGKVKGLKQGPFCGLLRRPLGRSSGLGEYRLYHSKAAHLELKIRILMGLSGCPLYHLHQRKKKKLTAHRPTVLAQKIQVRMLQEASPSQDTPLSPSHTLSGTPFHPPPTALPLRPGPPLQGEVRPFMTYVPFSTSDLYNWKLQNPSFSEKPQTLISLLETIFVTHQPTWDDCQQLLQVLSTTEERDKIRCEAQKLVMGPNGQPTEDPAVLEEVFPSSHPENWDPNTPHGDLVWVKRHEPKTLEPRWKGPHTVIPTTPTAVKVDGVRTWIHHSQVKKNCVKAGTTQTDTEPDNKQQWKVQRHPEDPLKLRLMRE